ncbi:MAG: hypothetical protein DWH82_00655 [Planctomycetota bacterium]|nr:MAG: hypothetical protein DWH82_00655 [Planctomycetota bacterium]
MFNYRKDKAGFVMTLVLGGILAAGVIATLVMLFMGLSRGVWDYYSLPIRIVLGCAWVMLVISVLVRVGIFRFQMKARQRNATAVARQVNEIQKVAETKPAR